MHKIDFYNPICIMKILPVRKRLSKPLASVATCASRQGNYRFRLANVFDSLFLPSRIFIIKQFFCKINFMFNFQKTRISGFIIVPSNIALVQYQTPHPELHLKANQDCRTDNFLLYHLKVLLSQEQFLLR